MRGFQIGDSVNDFSLGRSALSGSPVQERLFLSHLYRNHPSLSTSGVARPHQVSTWALSLAMSGLQPPLLCRTPPINCPSITCHHKSVESPHSGPSKAGCCRSASRNYTHLHEPLRFTISWPPGLPTFIRSNTHISAVSRTPWNRLSCHVFRCPLYRRGPCTQPVSHGMFSGMQPEHAGGQLYDCAPAPARCHPRPDR